MEKVLTVIPAKKRSTRLPGKNVALLAGKPLVKHAIDQAIASGVCGEICVATDDEEIARISRNAGASVPFFRTDDTDDITPVGVAALNVLLRYRSELRMNFDFICLLLATSPLREPKDIKACRDILFTNSNLDASMSIVYAEKHPCWSWTYENDIQISPMFPDKCHLDRKDLPKPYYVDGAVYWAKTAFFEKVNGNQYEGNIGGHIMPAWRAIDVDTINDLKYCEYLISDKTADKN